MQLGRTKPRAAALLGAVALLGCALAGCSSGASGTTTTTSSATVPSITTTTVPTTPGSSTVPATAAAAFLSTGPQQVLCTVTVTNGTSASALSRWSGLGTVDAKSKSYQLPVHPIVDPQGSPLTQTLLTNGGAYLGVPFLSTFAKDKSWIDLSASTADQVLGIAPLGLVINPVTAAQIVSAAGIKGTPLTPSPVLGQAARPYYVIVPAATVSDELAKAGAPLIVQQLASSLNGSRPLPIELWITSTGHLVEVGYQSSTTSRGIVHQYSTGCIVEPEATPAAIDAEPSAAETLTYEQYLAAVAAYNKHLKAK